MTNLSPAAQAVLDAFRAVPDLRDCPSIAASLRAAADQVGQVPADLASTEWRRGFSEGVRLAYREIYAIAAELEGQP